jgi:hypothetical protein
MFPVNIGHNDKARIRQIIMEGLIVASAGEKAGILGMSAVLGSSCYKVILIGPINRPWRRHNNDHHYGPGSSVNHPQYSCHEQSIML